MSATSIEEALVGFIRENFVPGNPGPEIDPGQDLLATGVLDSAGVLFLIGWLEAEFGVRIPDADLVPAHFSTVTAVASYLRARGAGGRGS